MTVRTYVASVGEVFSHIGTDRKVIHALAYVVDIMKSWENPDDRNYETDRLREGMPPIVLVDGEMKGVWSAHLLFRNDLAEELFSKDIRSRNTLCELGKFYKHLRTTPEFPSVVLHNILSKMLWISSGRGRVAKAA